MARALLAAAVVGNEEAERADENENVVNELEQMVLEVELEQAAWLVLGALELAQGLADLVVEDFQAFAVGEAFDCQLRRVRHLTAASSNHSAKF